MKRYPMYPEPKNLFSTFIEWIVLTVATIALLKYLLLFLIRNWWVIIILLVIAGLVALYRIRKRNQDRWY